MEGNLYEILEHLLARKAKTNAKKKAGKEEIKAHQDKADAQAGACLERMVAAMHSMLSDFERTVQQHMETLLEGSRSFEKGMTTSQRASEVCPEQMEAEVITFEGNLDGMEATDMEATPEETEATMVWQELFKKEINVDNIRSLKDRYGDRRLLCDVTDGQRSGSKRVLGPGRSCLSPGSD
jgi:hypothetical protein